MIKVSHPDGNVYASVHLTPSKSISNRALIISALGKAGIEIENISDSADTKILAAALRNLDDSIIDAGDAGTAFRFLTAFLSVTSGERILTGSLQMRKRPIGILVEALKELGAHISYEEVEGYPPLKITGSSLSGGELDITANQSSQFISALLLCGAIMEKGIKLNLREKIVSGSYIDMTIAMMKDRGVSIDQQANTLIVHSGNFQPGIIVVENDWSSASYWYEIAALSEDALIRIKGLRRESIQGDQVISSLMEAFGVRTTFESDGVLLENDFSNKLSFFEYDFSDCPDLVMTVAAVCAARRIPCLLSGLSNLRIKESDRLNSIRSELEKFGTDIIIDGETIRMTPGNAIPFGEIKMNVHDDHRIAMSLSPLALTGCEIILDDPTVVSKSYPGYWEELKSAGFLLTSD